MSLMLNNEMVQIQDLYTGKKGDNVRLKAMISGATVHTMKGDKQYIRLTIQDSTGIIEIPFWDNFEENQKLLLSGKIIGIAGTLDFYTTTKSTTPQINNPKYKILDNEDYKDYVPSFKIDPKITGEFLMLIESLRSYEYKTFLKRALGLDNYKKDRWTRFISAPAAERHHHNKIGGLFLHTFGVVKAAQSSIRNYFENAFLYSAEGTVNPERLILAAMLHDYMKTEEYEYESGTIKRKDILLDHIVLGVSYIREINKELGNILKEEDLDKICHSILTHHGPYGKYHPKTIEDILLHCADMIDSQISGAIEENNRKEPN
jgi:3'-5' exoribonuclease